MILSKYLIASTSFMCSIRRNLSIGTNLQRTGIDMQHQAVLAKMIQVGSLKFFAEPDLDGMRHWHRGKWHRVVVDGHKSPPKGRG